ncbi:MAG: hypothetical protein ONB27_11995 [candidate division KSB1 bacterium]|nr:hypothetical protein [candidate division KSB1 bacterium]
MQKIYLIFIISVLIALGCAIQQPVVEKKTPVIQVPPGIDTATVVIVDSIFARVQIPEKDESLARSIFSEAQLINHLADSLWETGINGCASREDSLLTWAQLSRAQTYLQSDRERFKSLKKMMKKMGQLHPAVLKTVSTELQLQALSSYQSAIRTNRFDVTYRRRLAQFLKQLADKSHDQNYLRQAAEELERVVFYVKGEHLLFLDLADTYFRLGDWQNAFKNYEFGKNALKKSAIFVQQNPKIYFGRLAEVPIDTNRLVAILDRQGLCKTKLYEAQPALALYREAKALTPDPDYKNIFESKIKWILWDDGNIRASEIRDHADSLRFVKNKYPEAKAVYLELLPLLWTKRTRDEINWRVATLDFDYLGNKEDGVARMHRVIKTTAVDSLTAAPLDSMARRYFNDYGRFCFMLGAENWEKDRLRSYIYFQQAAQTNYNERRKAFLQLAEISKFDPNETIALCQRAQDFEHELDKTEKEVLYRLLYQSYRKLGDFTKAKLWFDRWKEL